VIGVIQNRFAAGFTGLIDEKLQMLLSACGMVLSCFDMSWGIHRFVVPKSFDPLEFLKEPRLAMRADDARWFVSTILRKMASRNVDQWGFARLYSNILRRAMNQRTYKDVIETLLDGGAIERSPYEVGVKSFGYRLAKRYLNDHAKRRRAVDKRLIDRIERERQRMESQQAVRCRPIHEALKAVQQHLAITPEADDILGGLPEHTRLCQSVLVSLRVPSLTLRLQALCSTAACLLTLLASLMTRVLVACTRGLLILTV